MADTTIHYWLATSAVRFSGTRTTTVPAHLGPTRHTAAAQAELVVRADRHAGALTLQLRTGLLRDDTFSMTLTDDGRLQGSDVTHVGQGGVLLGAIASLAGQVIGAAAGATRPVRVGVVPEPGDDDTTAVVDESSFGEQELLTALVDRENVLARQLLVATDKDQLSAIGTALGLVAAQRQRLETARAIWAAGTATTQDVDVTLDLGQLPTAQQLHGEDGGLDGRPEARDVWHRLGIMATVEAYRPVDDPDSELGSAPDEPLQAGGGTRAWYRLPRPATVTVWRADLDHPRAAPTVVRVSTTIVVDRHARLLSLPVAEHGLFGQHQIAVTMGATGTPVSYGVRSHSAAADSASALAGLTGGVGGGIADLAKARTAVAGLGAPDEVARLTVEKETLELQAAIVKLRKG